VSPNVAEQRAAVEQRLQALEEEADGILRDAAYEDGHQPDAAELAAVAAIVQARAAWEQARYLARIEDHLVRMVNR